MRRGRLYLRTLILMLSAPIVLLSTQTGVIAQQRSQGVSFVNERTRIPDSVRFNDGAYIASGVGLKFGVDKRLSYLSGDYGEAVVAFQEAIGSYRFKAEIWVYLARAHFYSESPERAKQTLDQAAQVMPDLDRPLWQPLIESLLDEVRQRANQQQIQVDFYSPDQQGLLSLFRLYLFLEDFGAAQGVIDAAFSRSRGMRDRSTMVAGSSLNAFLDQAQLWDDLGRSLASELRNEGVEVPRGADPAPVAVVENADAQAAERDRLLQLRVDFYRANPEEFVELFDSYLRSGNVRGAKVVADRAQEEVNRLRLVASVAATYQDEYEMDLKVTHMDSLHTAFVQQLATVGAAP